MARLELLRLVEIVLGLKLGLMAMSSSGFGHDHDQCHLRDVFGGSLVNGCH